LAAGSYSFEAQYNGDGNYAASPMSAAEPLSIYKGSVGHGRPGVSTAIFDSTGGAVTGALGEQVYDTTAVSGTPFTPTGTVTYEFFKTIDGTGPYTDQTVTLNADGTVPNSALTSALVAGSYSFIGVYSGDSNYVGFAGAVEPLTINQASSSVSTAIFDSTGGAVTGALGEQVYDTAAVSGTPFTPTGTVTYNFYNTASPVYGTTTPVSMQTVTLSGGVVANSATTAALTAGGYAFIGVYSGDSNYTGYVGGVEPLTINKASLSITTKPSVVCAAGNGQFATIGFWHNKNGQALINSFNGCSTATLLGNSLASNFPHLFGVANPYTGAAFAGLTNAQIATVYSNLWTPSGLPKNTYVQAFATALGLYASGGLGTYNIGSNGAAFGYANNTTLTVTQILQIVDANFAPTTGFFYGGDQTKTSDANNVLNGINSSGESPCGCTVVASGAELVDSATLTGGYHETGTITFTLYAPGGSVVETETATVNGDGTYNTPNGYLPTATGTYQWVVVYSGDSNNNGVTSPFGSEPWTVGAASPTTISTTPNYTAVTLGTTAVTLKDTANLAGGDSPTGTITFTLYLGSTLVDTEPVTVTGNGTYTTPGYTLPTTGTVIGTYQWDASYSGDANNSQDSDNNDCAERVVVCPATPAISTTPTPTTVTLSTTAITLKDSATLSGGYFETGAITFTLYAPGNTLVDTETVTASGNGTYTTPTGYTLSPTGAVTGTYQWNAAYSGNANNKAVSDNNDCAERVAVSAVTTISGTKFNDLTGNGFSSDDTGKGGVTVNLYKESNCSSGLQTGCGGDSLVASTTTASNGTYGFSGLAAGTYYVQEVVPAGYVQTGGGPNGSAGNTYYTICAQKGQAYGGNNFDDFQVPACSPSNVSFKVTNGSGNSTTVTDLRGNTQPGDTVQVTFTVPAGMSDQLTLVSYTAPGPTYVASTAYQQQIYQQATGTFAPGGPYTLTVQIPNGNYQIDFVCGPAINQLGPPLYNGNPYGPDSSNIYYSAEGRLISADNSGPMVISGTVFADSKNLNCVQDAGETGINGVTLKLVTAGPDGLFGTADDVVQQTTTSNGSGQYMFTGVPTGLVMIVESTPSGYIHVGQVAGTAGGTLAANAIITTLPTNGSSISNNFADFQIPTGQPSGITSSTATFNSTAIPQTTSGGQNYLWFSDVVSASVASGTLSGVQAFIVNQTVKFTAGGKSYSLLVPNAMVTFSPTATVATTTFDAAASRWETTVPYNISGNVFLAGLPFPVPAGGLPGSISVTWSGNFLSTVNQLTAKWKWAAAVYKSFSTTYSNLGVKPVDSSTVYCSAGTPYKNSDYAGTPESYKTSVIAGASGSGGTNYTGNYSSVVSVVACDPPLNTAAAANSATTTTAQPPANTGSTISLAPAAKPAAKAAVAAADEYFSSLGTQQAVKTSKPATVKSPITPVLLDACMVQVAAEK
jgi:hypothetical protein